jgi:hypothetical protein
VKSPARVGVIRNGSKVICVDHHEVKVLGRCGMEAGCGFPLCDKAFQLHCARLLAHNRKHRPAIV